IETRLHRNVTVREENSVAALEAMSRFAANPRWLVYLQPTVSPPETSRRPELLEHPDEAFAYFRREGVVRVVCEEKHMGSRAALDKSGFWNEHKTDWAVLDCELMPWSVKAQDLIRDQYAAVGAASRAALADSMPALDAAAARGVDIAELLPRTRERTHLVGRYVEAYRSYCWPVRSLDDLKLAPFHLLATESAVHTDKNHDWHMQVLAKVC